MKHVYGRTRKPPIHPAEELDNLDAASDKYQENSTSQFVRILIIRGFRQL